MVSMGIKIFGYKHTLSLGRIHCRVRLLGTCSSRLLWAFVWLPQRRVWSKRRANLFSVSWYLCGLGTFFRILSHGVRVWVVWGICHNSQCAPSSSLSLSSMVLGLFLSNFRTSEVILNFSSTTLAALSSISRLNLNPQVLIKTKS